MKEKNLDWLPPKMMRINVQAPERNCFFTSVVAFPGVIELIDEFRRDASIEFFSLSPFFVHNEEIELTFDSVLTLRLTAE